MIMEKLATNMAMEVKAARSRRKSVIIGSFSIYVLSMFYFCSFVNRLCMPSEQAGGLEAARYARSGREPPAVVVWLVEDRGRQAGRGKASRADSRRGQLPLQEKGVRQRPATVSPRGWPSYRSPCSRNESGNRANTLVSRGKSLRKFADGAVLERDPAVHQPGQFAVMGGDEGSKARWPR